MTLKQPLSIIEKIPLREFGVMKLMILPNG